MLGSAHHGLRTVAGDPPISAEPWIVRTGRARGAMTSQLVLETTYDTAFVCSDAATRG
jgi:hypothetical protein